MYYMFSWNIFSSVMQFNFKSFTTAISFLYFFTRRNNAFTRVYIFWRFNRDFHFIFTTLLDFFFCDPWNFIVVLFLDFHLRSYTFLSVSQQMDEKKNVNKTMRSRGIMQGGITKEISLLMEICARRLERKFYSK